MKMLKEEYDEWVKTVRLAHYKRLSLDPESLESNERYMLGQLRNLLLEDGFSEEALASLVEEYKDMDEETRMKEVEEKVKILVGQICEYLDGVEEISSIDYPELYHRIQELVALNSTLANELLRSSYDEKGIHHCMCCGDSLFGRPCTYYFSKKLTYK